MMSSHVGGRGLWGKLKVEVTDTNDVLAANVSCDKHTAKATMILHYSHLQE